MIRAFLAVRLTDRLKENLGVIQSDLKRRLLHDLPPNASLTWVRPASLHVTVKFLGDIEDALVERLQETISDTLSGSDRPISGTAAMRRHDWRRSTGPSRIAVPP
jgi:2'-5' RNA ligase